jgi:hypothetical protein
MHSAGRRDDYGGRTRQKSGTPGGNPGPSKPTTFEELNRILQSRNRSLSTRINSVLQVLEENRDNLRGFFAACYQTLLWQIFNFDDGANGWLQSVSSGNERDAWLLLDFLSPHGRGRAHAVRVSPREAAREDAEDASDGPSRAELEAAVPKLRAEGRARQGSRAPGSVPLLFVLVRLLRVLVRQVLVLQRRAEEPIRRVQQRRRRPPVAVDGLAHDRS